ASQEEEAFSAQTLCLQSSVQVVLLETQLAAHHEQDPEDQDEAHLDDPRPSRLGQGSLDDPQQRRDEAADDQDQLREAKAVLALECGDVQLFEVGEQLLLQDVYV